MPNVLRAIICLFIVSVFVLPRLSYAETDSDIQFLAEIDAALAAKNKAKQQAKSDVVEKPKKSAKSSNTAKSNKLVKAVHSGNPRTVKSYVSYRKSGSHVSTRCFPKRLHNVLKKVEKRYGVKPIVNSGFRSAKQNRRVGGARKSYHVKCMAADIRVPGVSKYKLARYLKGVSGVGGVGTYACKNFIHVDVGPKRSWHWRCRGRRNTRA